MKIIIPAIYFEPPTSQDETSIIRRIHAVIKSYFSYSNTYPLTVATNLSSVESIVNTMATEHGYPLNTIEVDVDGIDLCKYCYGGMGSVNRPYVTASKLYTMHRVCADEDAVLVIDSDTLITGKIPFSDIVCNGITVFQPFEWFDYMEMRTGSMVINDALDAELDIMSAANSYASVVGMDTIPMDIMDNPWLNSGFTLVTREFREKHMDFVLDECARDEFRYNKNGLDERILLYLQLARGRNDAGNSLTIDRSTRLNVPTLYLCDDSVSVADRTYGLHYHLGIKPSEVNVKSDGTIDYASLEWITDPMRPFGVQNHRSVHEGHQIAAIYMWRQFDMKNHG